MHDLIPRLRQAREDLGKGLADDTKLSESSRAAQSAARRAAEGDVLLATHRDASISTVAGEHFHNSFIHEPHYLPATGVRLQ